MAFQSGFFEYFSDRSVLQWRGRGCSRPGCNRQYWSAAEDGLGEFCCLGCQYCGPHVSRCDDNHAMQEGRRREVLIPGDKVALERLVVKEARADGSYLLVGEKGDGLQITLVILR